ncbi:MAG: hypothetical protein LBT73_01445 [Tannerellaceae bacterium]|jgi:hypothetical protein|nr:hypothetical protein [Tannerellaceae bacterium]
MRKSKEELREAMDEVWGSGWERVRGWRGLVKELEEEGWELPWRDEAGRLRVQCYALRMNVNGNPDRSRVWHESAAHSEKNYGGTGLSAAELGVKYGISTRAVRNRYSKWRYSGVKASSFWEYMGE